MIERAYFDFTPTLNYDSSSRFFYAADGWGVESYWAGLVTGYYNGINDVMPDIPRTGIPSDENFLYATGYNGRQGPWFQTNGGLYIFRYFRDKIGGDISGYTSSTDLAFREVNLEGTFTVERNTHVLSGATVHLLKTTKFEPGINTTLTVSGTLSIETLGDAGRGYCGVPVIVKSGGKLIVRAGSVFDFRKKVTVERGGEFTIEENATVVLENSDNEVHGHFKVLGTSTGRSKVKAKLTTDRTAVESTARSRIRMLGGNGFSLGTSLRIKYADFTDVRIDAQYFTPASPSATSPDNYTLYSSTFKAKEHVAGYGFLVNLRGRTLFSAYQNIKIKDCTFESLGGANTNRYYTVTGLALEQYRNPEVTESDFSHLALGFSGNLLTRPKITDNQFNYAKQHVNLRYCVSPTVCNNNLMFGTIGIGSTLNTGSSSFFNNTLHASQSALIVQGGQMHFLRMNSFEDHCQGIYGRDAALILGRFPVGMTWHTFGRNSFLTPSTISGVFACSSTRDIHLTQGSELHVACGYNYFDDNTLYHVSDDGTASEPLYVDYNEWVDPLGHAVRTTLTYEGSPLNTSETVTETCASMLGSGTCSVSVAVADNGGTWKELLGTDPILRTGYADSRTAFTNSSLSIPLRKMNAHQALEAAVLMDSTAAIEQLIGDYRTLSNTSTLASSLRSTSLMLKGVSHELLGQQDSAIATYTLVVQNYTTSIDSIPAAWSLQSIAASIDTLVGDSLHGDLATRIYNDLMRIAPLPTGSPKITTADHSEAQVLFSVGDPVPNPASGSSAISIALGAEAPVIVTILDVMGREVLSVVKDQYAGGEHTFNVNTSSLTPGTYFYRVEVAGKVETRKFSVQH